jgi:3-hydroxyisobutyrate dehydrogenase-like beta-hydroxyacid dehydrogenase
MLGDAIVYGFSLYAIERGSAWHARAALLKGVIMAAFGVGVLGQVAQQLYQKMSAQGDGSKDFSAIINLYRRP